MTVTIAPTTPVRPSLVLIEAYRGIAPATIGHLAGYRIMSSTIKQAYPSCRLVGTAFTVSAPAPDNAAAYQACDLIGAGEVMVVERGGDIECACVGEFRALAQQQKGVAGWIIDGAGTDIRELGEIRFPVFARAWSARVGANLNLTGTIGIPVICGGVIVNPGDLIVADDSGVAVLSPTEAERLLDYCIDVEAREAAQRSRRLAGSVT
jgi:regulator of RNase E activity RraA